MRYFGSKVTTLDAIEAVVRGRHRRGTVCDPFGGIATVGARLKTLNYRIVTGDVMWFAHMFQVARVVQNRRPAFKGLRDLGVENASQVETLLRQYNSDGWFVREYADWRRFFRRGNAIRIQGCWNAIRAWNRQGRLSSTELSVLTASLINSMDRVANTAGTYYAYLKHWSEKGQQDFRFNLLSPTLGHPDCVSSLTDAKETASQGHHTVLYLDPPYNHRDYSQYYHLPETIARLGQPRVHGKSGVPDRAGRHSRFCRRADATKAIVDLVEDARFKTLIVHYSDDGLIPRSDLRRLLRRFGTVEESVVDSKGYTTQRPARTTRHRLYVVGDG